MSKNVRWLSRICALATLFISFSLGSGLFPETDCLARNMYYEARSEGIYGMVAVGQVSLNRTKHPNYPSSICSVVYQKSQFSWTLKQQPLPMGPHWELAKQLAVDMINGDTQVDNFEATHYHATYAKPRWKYKMRKITSIGKHIFYRDKNETTKSA